MTSRAVRDEGIRDSDGNLTGLGAGVKELRSARMWVSEIVGRSVKDRRRAQTPWMVALMAIFVPWWSQRGRQVATIAWSS